MCSQSNNFATDIINNIINNLNPDIMKQEKHTAKPIAGRCVSVNTAILLTLVCSVNHFHDHATRAVADVFGSEYATSQGYSRRLDTCCASLSQLLGELTMQSISENLDTGSDEI